MKIVSQESIVIIDQSAWVEELFAPYKDLIGKDFKAYRGHVYRIITFAMHFLNGDESQRKMVETVSVYHDIGLWSDHNLAYLEPSEVLALKDNESKSFGLDPKTLKAAIHWHHKITPYAGPAEKIVNAIRKADWIDFSQGMISKGISREEIKAVQEAIPDYGFLNVLLRLARDIGGSIIKGNLKVLRYVFKF